MLPAVAMGIAQGAIGLGQALFGAAKLKKSKKAADAAIAGIETYQADPLAAQRLNAPMPGEAEAQQSIGQTQTQSLSAAKTRKGGLASIAGVAAGTNKAKQDLAVKKAGYKLGAEQAVMGERTKAFQSRQQKQQLQADIALQEVAANRQNISQGLSGLASGLGGIAGAGMFGGGNKSDKMSDKMLSMQVSQSEQAKSGLSNFLQNRESISAPAAVSGPKRWTPQQLGFDEPIRRKTFFSSGQ